MDLVNMINDIFGSWAGVVLALIGIFAALATIIPAPSASSGWIYKGFHALVSWLACNFGQAKNEQKRV